MVTNITIPKKKLNIIMFIYLHGKFYLKSMLRLLILEL